MLLALISSIEYTCIFTLKIISFLIYLIYTWAPTPDETVETIPSIF